MRKTLVLVVSILLLAACNSNLVYSEYRANTGGYWSREDVKEFNFAREDTISSFNLFINIRNDNAYPFNNLFLITDLNFPDGTVVRDTLEYEMALPSGEWMGKGYGSLKENKLWYKEKIVFPLPGVYTLRVAHAMRQNGVMDGIKELEGITDVGFQIEAID